MLYELENPTALLDDSFPLPLDRPFTTAMAGREGISPRHLGALVRSAQLRRLLKGVYVAAQVPDSIVLRMASLRLVVPAGCVVVDRTAGWLHGAPVLPPNSHVAVPPLDLFRLPGNTRLRYEFCRSGQRTLLPSDVMEIDGLLVATPLRTALDLGRGLRRLFAIGALDGLLRLGAFTHGELLAEVERFKRQRGVVQLRELAPLADPRSQSPGESSLRLLWLDAPDLPPPVCQVPVRNDAGREIFFLDLGVEKLRFAAEYDGQLHHSSPEDREHDRRRRAWLGEERGWIIKVFENTDVYGPQEDVAFVLRRGVVDARRRLGAFRGL